MINIFMLFAYLNLPPVPTEMIDACIDNIKYIGNHPVLNQINSVREEVIRSTFVPKPVVSWMIENVSSKFNPMTPEIQKVLFNVTSYSEYRKDPEWWGSQMKHVDNFRHYAVNFYVDTGGDNVRTQWYSEDDTLEAETVIEPFRWSVLKVNPNIHAVKGIMPGRRRLFLSTSILTTSIENFNEEEYFKDLIIPGTMI